MKSRRLMFPSLLKDAKTAEEVLRRARLLRG
jgi:hypothetical protein